MHKTIVHHAVSSGITLDQVAAVLGAIAAGLAIWGAVNLVGRIKWIKERREEKAREKEFGPIFTGSMSRGVSRMKITFKKKEEDDGTS